MKIDGDTMLSDNIIKFIRYMVILGAFYILTLLWMLSMIVFFMSTAIPDFVYFITIFMVIGLSVVCIALIRIKYVGIRRSEAEESYGPGTV
jgi:ABC-type transport system involved in multi-copper enzyme maturation permease subunit